MATKTAILAAYEKPVGQAPDSGLSLLAVADPQTNGATFEELAVPLLEPLYNFAHWLTYNREEAEDLVQETYIKALKGFSSFQPGTNFRAWMFRILRNTFLTSRTGLAAKMTVALADEEDEAAVAVTPETPESIFLRRAGQEAVQRALESLSLPFREVLLLCDLEEMKYSEIAHTLDIPIGTVMSRISRARKAMQQALQAEIGAGQAARADCVNQELRNYTA